MIAQIQMRRGTTAEWAAASPVVLAAGEPGYDTTLKRLKVGDGATEWASLGWIDYATNPNILHNWDFRNPINQRGVSGIVSAAGYFVDRWYKYAAGEIEITSAGLNCGSAIIEQRIEGTGLAGQTATFSIMIGGVIYAKTMTFPSDTGTVISSFDMPMPIVFGHDTTSMRVRLNAPPDALTYQAVKLELGTVSTLHLDPPMDWAVELPKCYRFFYKAAPARIPGRCNNATTVYASMTLPASMRAVPTSDSTSGTVHFSTGAVAFSSISFTLREGGLGVTASGASGLTTGAAAVVELSAQLSADL